MTADAGLRWHVALSANGSDVCLAGRYLSYFGDATEIMQRGVEALGQKLWEVKMYRVAVLERLVEGRLGNSGSYRVK